MARAPLVEEIATVRSLCRNLGLGDAEPILLKAAHHTTLQVCPQLVARVQSSEPLDEAVRTAALELAVARYLVDHGALVPAPLDRDLSGPHIAGSAVVTLWPFVEHRRAEEADALPAARALAHVHRCFRDYPGPLPPYTDALDHCQDMLDDVATTPALPAEDRSLLNKRLQQLRADAAAQAGDWAPLHGDPHLGNVWLVGDQAVWADFEDACMGPPEYDIAVLPPAVWPVFPDADQGLIQLCAGLRSVCVAVWCSAELDRSAEVREAAAFHLDLVRGSAT